jgi:hypothetical protein
MENGYIGRPLSEWINIDYSIGWFKQDEILKKHLDDKVVAVHSMSWDEEGYVPSPFKHRYIFVWVELESGYAVGFNENPNTGWSYPIKRYSK